MGALKKEENIAILQSQRWNEVFKKMLEMGEARGLTQDFVERIFKAIHQESITHQGKMMK